MKNWLEIISNLRFDRQSLDLIRTNFRIVNGSNTPNEIFNVFNETYRFKRSDIIKNVLNTIEILKDEGIEDKNLSKFMDVIENLLHLHFKNNLGKSTKMLMSERNKESIEKYDLVLISIL